MTVKISSNYSYVSEEARRILVVDDDPIQREFAIVYLSAPGAEIVTAENGQQALALASQQTFDIVLLDHEMPGMSGLELVAEMRNRPRLAGTPLIMVTAHEDIATVDAAYKAGATSFFAKPINWRLLEYQIEHVLRAHRGKAA